MTGIVVGAALGVSVLVSGKGSPSPAVVESRTPITTDRGALEPTNVTSPSTGRVHLDYLPSGVQYDATVSNPRKGGLLYDLYTIAGAANLDTMAAHASQNRADGTQHPKTQLVVSKQADISTLPYPPANPRFNLVVNKMVNNQDYRLTTPLDGYGYLTVEWVRDGLYYCVGNEQLRTSEGTSGLGMDELFRLALGAG